jgi:hypothetical protein
MEKKNKRPVYVPPRAMDLTAFGATGTHPLGACKAGNYPYTNCVVGTVYVGSCFPGSTVDTSACSVGGYHAQPTCTVGAVAATICISGNHQQG